MKQLAVVLSSTEAEYRGAAIATCEVIWLKRLLKDLQVKVSAPTAIYCDNLSSIHLAKNPVFHARTVHIEVHYPLPASVSSPVKSNFNMSRRIGRTPTSSPSPLVSTSCGNSRVRLGCDTSMCRI